MPVRTRFAPSPTGSLHLGNLRTAIFNYYFARGADGSLLLRIEDTDMDRNQEGSLQGILDDLRWAGLDWAEGPDIGGPHAPYLQSMRGDRHRELALELEAKGAAYRCWCPEEGDEGRPKRESPACPGGCREMRVRGEVGEGPAALRFAVPDGLVEIVDEVRGPITFHGKDIGDFIILRSDGRATYNFAVVADDIDMEITHVIRGAGHLPNTPKHALLFDALGAPRPAFAHLPTVLAPGGGKLSKRSGAAGIGELRAAGYHPQGVVNYLSLLGWSPGDDREVLTREELIEAMNDLSRIGATDTAFDPEKLRWMSGQHIARMGIEEMTTATVPYLDSERFPLDRARLRLALEAIRSRLHTFGEVNEHLALLFPPEDRLAAGRGELSKSPEVAPLLGRVAELLKEVEPWAAEGAGGAIRRAGKEVGVGGPALFHPVRLALFGSRDGPDLGKSLAAVGKDAALARLTEALRIIP